MSIGARLVDISHRCVFSSCLSLPPRLCNLSAVRCFTSTPSMTVFDRNVKIAQRNRSAIAADSRDYDYLRDEVAARLIERLTDIKRKFTVVADLGANTGNIEKQLKQQQQQQQQQQTTTTGIQTFLQLEMAEQMLMRDRIDSSSSSSSSSFSVFSVISDEEFLPLQAASCDLLLSSMSLHWVNDLPSVFSQIVSALKPDGVFLGALLGGATLQELRSAFSLADRERSDTLLPHLSPFINGQDLGDLITAAGFALPTIDTESITIRYPDMFTLCHHLQAMGEQNAQQLKSTFTSSKTFLSAASIYQELYADEEGLIPATFQIYYIIGWAPHHSQPKPLRRGSAKFKLGQLEQLIEKSKVKGEISISKQKPEQPSSPS